MLSYSRQQAIWLLALAVALVVSRWALFPRYLIMFDEINFALAVDRFDPGAHQPQPPGYPLFVALLKLLALCVPKIETVFLIASLLVSAAALVLLWRLCELIIGPNRGIIGALLLLFNPPFWLAAITNPVRLCLAAGALAVALCVWLACQRNSSRWFVLAAAVLGVCAGARPSLPILLAPLMFWAAWQIRLPWKAAALAVLCFCAAVAAWLSVLIMAAGGFRQFLEMLRVYSEHQMAADSALFGAPLRNALQMAWEALTWSCLGALSWLWAVPFVMRKAAGIFGAFTTRFLALWFFPGLLFWATFHVGDPDHTLLIIPVTCIAGALVLTALTRKLSQAKRTVTIGFCVLLNVFLFFKPISETTIASTYKPVRWMKDYIADVLEGAGSLRDKGPVTVVFDENAPGWRQLSYYDPRAHIIVIMREEGQPLTTRHIIGKQATTRTSADGVVALPSCGTLAWTDPVARPVAASGIPLQSTHSRVFFTPAVRGESFEFHGLQFVSGEEACDAEAASGLNR